MKWMRTLGGVIIVILLLYGIYHFTSAAQTEQKENILTEVEYGPFEIYVTATGEIEAKKSIKIRGPQGMRSVGVYQTTITDLIPEGSVVEKGDYIATLDRTELATKLTEAETEIDKTKTQLEQAKIDTAITLREVRDQIANTRFALKEKRLQVEQSQFEPKMVIRQAELELERTERDLDQLLHNYKLKQAQSRAKISEINTLLRQHKIKLQRLQEVGDQFRITAPEAGMVIYERGWGGKKGPGSQISSWNPVVAELPDLTEMISKVYVNEVDISKVRRGQQVNIKVDAFPENQYSGTVTQVANVGQELRNQDAKVFEVIVELLSSDTILRPSMTTRNDILVHSFKERTFIPLEALHVDSLNYVITKRGGKTIRQEVITGPTNSDHIIIASGLEEGDRIYLTYAGDPMDLPMHHIPLENAEEIRKQLQTEEKQRELESRRKEKETQSDYKAPEESRGNVIIIE